MKKAKTIQMTSIKLPFWLRWAKRYIKIETTLISADYMILYRREIIIDKDLTTNRAAKAYANKILKINSPERKEKIGRIA